MGMGIRDYDDLCIRFKWGVYMAFVAAYDIYDLAFRCLIDSMACYLYEYFVCTLLCVFASFTKYFGHDS